MYRQVLQTWINTIDYRMQWTKVKFIPIEHTKYIHIARANTIYGKNTMSETETTKNAMNKPKNVSVK